VCLPECATRSKDHIDDLDSASSGPEKRPLVENAGRLGAPVAGIRQMIAIGLNYRHHAKDLADGDAIDMSTTGWARNGIRFATCANTAF
jgi:hypothetical protein